MLCSIIVKLKIDEENFDIPADGDIDQQLKDEVTQFLYDMSGIEIKAISVCRNNQ